MAKTAFTSPAMQAALERAQAELLSWALELHGGVVSELPDSISTLALENEELAQALVILRQAAGNIGHDPDPFHQAVKAVSEEIRRIERLYQQMEVEKDALTGVNNRHGMIRDLQKEWTRSQRSMDSLCIAMADIDHFKEVNDTFGHQVGDLVLTHVAQFLESRLRPYDTVYRYGGEEFLICLPTTDLDRAELILERLRRLLARMPVHAGPGTLIPVTVSIGLVEFTPGLTVPAAIAAADRALYMAKAQGRNQLVTAAQLHSPTDQGLLH